MHRNSVVLVDENDQEIGREEKLLAHQQGLLHRAFSVFITRQHEGVTQLLLQQRAACKYHGALLWSNSCCSHPQPNEDVQSSALARVVEELGIHLKKITWVGSHTYKAVMPNLLIEHEYDHLFVAQENPALNHFNPQEVEALKWQSVADIERDLKLTPELFTPWFAPTFHKVKSALTSH
ncbi:MAG: isopentenyl-diphosphate delta-isomerase [Gammaproteobacteria bacterium MedPE]|nr:MAG: isopentenyl-diphosphate delta-isomerase [Gammaproteobacteria bacterium MedPE]